MYSYVYKHHNGDDEVPEVSVVIPLYSRVDWLIEAVDSVLTQTYKDFEIIVVNDGSPEDMLEFLSQYSEKIKYKVKENGGPSNARMRGFITLREDILLFLIRMTGMERVHTFVC